VNKTPHTFYTIRFTDCDPFGHLNNARYIDYFLNAREDHLKDEFKINLSDFYKQGVSWLVSGHEISYMRPANYHERVSIQTALIQVAPGSLMVEMIMMDENHSHLKSCMWTSFTHVNVKTGKREIHSDVFMEFARSVEIDHIDISKGFQQRVKEIIEDIKKEKEARPR
jgi:acyl-CoA thioester hydrolase